MATLADVKTRLEAQRDRLRRQIEEQSAILPAYDGSPTESRYGNHAADEATDTFEEEKALALRAHFVAELYEVEHALRKLERGEYGVCEECGRPIEQARLEAMPFARLCIECQGRAERRR
jgi:RNA polymerase-binding protein DksA